MYSTGHVTKKGLPLPIGQALGGQAPGNDDAGYARLDILDDHSHSKFHPPLAPAFHPLAGLSQLAVSFVDASVDDFLVTLSSSSSSHNFRMKIFPLE